MFTLIAVALLALGATHVQAVRPSPQVLNSAFDEDLAIWAQSNFSAFYNGSIATDGISFKCLLVEGSIMPSSINATGFFDLRKMANLTWTDSNGTDYTQVTISGNFSASLNVFTNASVSWPGTNCSVVFEGNHTAAIQFNITVRKYDNGNFSTSVTISKMHISSIDDLIVKGQSNVPFFMRPVIDVALSVYVQATCGVNANLMFESQLDAAMNDPDTFKHTLALAEGYMLLADSRN